MLKIDGSFVRDILRDERAESMVRAIAQLARAMNITTVAEYVETEEIRTRVRALGVDYGQGFAIARPVPVGEVLDVLPVLAAATPGAFLLDEPRATPAEPRPSVSRSELGFAPMKLLLIGIVLGIVIAARRRGVRASRRRPHAAAWPQRDPRRPASAALDRRRNRASHRSHGARAARVRRRSGAAANSSTMRCAAWSADSIRIPPISMPRSTPICA